MWSTEACRKNREHVTVMLLDEINACNSVGGCNACAVEERKAFCITLESFELQKNES